MSKLGPPKQRLAIRPFGVGMMALTRPGWSQTWMPMRVAT